MLPFNLKQLEAFTAVVDTQSFSAAAEKLFLTQSTVSSHVRLLEEALGVPLLSRESKRPLRLTAEGSRIYTYAKTILEDCEKLRTDFDREQRTDVFLASSSLPAQQLVPELVTAFMRACPGYTCIVRDGDSEAAQQMLLNGEAEIGFVGSSDYRSLLHYKKLGEDRLILAAPNTPYYAGLKAKGLCGRDLLGEPMLTRETGSATQKLADNYLSSLSEPVSLKVAARISSLDTMRDMIIRGAGTAILSEGSVHAQILTGTILAFDLEPEPVLRNIYLAYRKKGLMSRGAAALLKFIDEGYREKP